MKIAKAKICVFLLACAGILTVTVAVSGCSGKKQKKEAAGDTSQQYATPSEEPTVEKTRGSVSRSTKPAPKGLFPVEGMTDISDNPGYFTAKEIPLTADAARDLDGVIRPILTKLFGAAKIVAEGGPDPNRPGGDVLLNSVTYVVRQILSHQECDNLHAAFTSAHFITSPRYGSKPVHSTSGGFVLMSLFTHSDIRSYSLGIRIDLNTQTICVESYQLGSKYDRIM
jgi:hypothetical protein